MTLTSRAQALQRLTVLSFTLSADTRNPQIEVPFHLIVQLRVRERISEIDNLELPILAELELLGDERRIESGPAGTLYRETITVVAHHGGAIALAPATLQAIDARDGKPKQWFTNQLTLQVAGPRLEPLQSAAGALRTAWVVALRALVWLAWIAGTLCAIAVLIFIFRRRPTPVMPVQTSQPPASPPVIPPRSRRDQLQDALSVLRAEPTRTTAVRARALLWRMVGASDGETLADVLRRPEAADARMRELLRALERAAFTYDDDLTNAIHDACTTLERYLA